MNCPECGGDKIKKAGKDRKGDQRYVCLACEKSFQDRPRLLGDMSLPLDKALLCLRLLVEGNSVRSTARTAEIHHSTVLNLLVTVGEKCEKLLAETIKDVPVKNCACDEVWGFVGMKEKTKHKLALMEDEESNQLGDAYCFIAMDIDTKLILAWHLGRRTVEDTIAFTVKIDHATKGHFQINTDGFAPYRDAFGVIIGHRTDFAQIVKVFGKPTGDEYRYSPPEVIEMIKTTVHGRPDMDKATTSHIERQNLTVRMGMRRMTRLTNGFSKKRYNLRMAYAIQFAYYNFVRIHSTLRVTPAMESNVTDHVWTLQELLARCTD